MVKCVVAIDAPPVRFRASAFFLASQAPFERLLALDKQTRMSTALQHAVLGNDHVAAASTSANNSSTGR